MNLVALSAPNFRIYMIGNLFALNALWMLRLIVGWIAWDVTGSAAFVGTIGFLYFAPTIFAGPFLGVVADRLDLRRAALAVQGLFFAGAMFLWVAQSYGVLGPGHLLIFAIGIGLATAAHGPVRMSLVPRLVDQTMIPSIVNITSITYNVSRMTGPVIGGWLIGNLGNQTATLITAVCYIPFFVALLRLDVRPSKSKRKPRRFWHEFSEAIEVVWAFAELRIGLIAASIAGVFLFGTLEILPVIADGAFDKGPTGLGILTASAGVGSIIAGVLLALRFPATADARGFVIVAGLLMGSFAVAGVAVSQAWLVAIGFVATVSGAASGTGIVCQVALQTNIDDGLRGRVMSLWASLAIGGSAIGSLILGFGSEFLGYKTALICASLAAVVLTVSLVRKRFS